MIQWFFFIDEALLNKSWRQHPTIHQVYGHLPPITKTIQVRRTRHAGHCWRSRDELISDVLLWTPTHGRAKAGRPARTYIQQLCEDTGCCTEDLPEAMNNREKWRERVRNIRATSTTWWWWWFSWRRTWDICKGDSKKFFYRRGTEYISKCYSIIKGKLFSWRRTWDICKGWFNKKKKKILTRHQIYILVSFNKKETFFYKGGT